MSTWCSECEVDPAGRHEPHRPVDLAGHPLVPLTGPGGQHELLVPLVHPGQVAHAGGWSPRGPGSSPPTSSRRRGPSGTGRAPVASGVVASELMMSPR